jgi:hypothetical protein
MPSFAFLHGTRKLNGVECRQTRCAVWYVAYEIFSGSCDDVIFIFCRSKQQRLYQANHLKLTLRFDFLEWRLFAMTKSGQIA